MLGKKTNLDLIPASGHPMSVEDLGQPCRNFNILAIERIIDPSDGREKVVLSNFAAGEIGNLILIDPVTGEGESLPLPGDCGAWALLKLDNESLIVGTCPNNAYIHRFDLRTRQWAKPLRIGGETYLWSLCRGSDGMVYGGTYPGCLLLQYDPEQHELKSVGRLSENKGNLYGQLVCATPNHILCNIRSAEVHVATYELATGTVGRIGTTGDVIREANEHWICLAQGKALTFFDAHSLAPIAAPSEGPRAPWSAPYTGTARSVVLADGRHLFIRGQEYGIACDGEDRPALQPIPTGRPATHIMTIAVDEHGVVWGSSGFGQTIFSFDPRSGRNWNSSAVCDQLGEVYGIVPLKGKLFMSAYFGGDHVVYDPACQWNQVENLNPQTLRTVGPKLCRPRGRSVLGPDGGIWTGWMAEYGVYGGGLSRIDPDTLEVLDWYDPFPEEGLFSVAADERYVYFTTTGEANGMDVRAQTLHLAAWDPAGHIAWSHAFEPPNLLGGVWVVHGRILVCVGADLQVFDPRTRALVGTITTGEQAATACQPLANGQVLVFCIGGGMWLIDPHTLTSQAQGPLPGNVASAVRGPDGTIYAAVGSRLYAITT